MAKTVKEIYYEKSLTDTLLDIENAFMLIGKIKKVDSEAHTVWGTTKFGLQKVKIEVQAEPAGDKTKITFRGKSDDVYGSGAKNGIENLLSTMQNLDNPDYVPNKTAGLSPVVSILLIIEVILSFIIVWGARTGEIEQSLIIVLGVLWVALFVYILIFGSKRKKKRGK